MEKAKRFTFGRVLLATALLAFFSFLAIIFFETGKFYGTLDAFSGAVSRGDQLAARDNLYALDYFYQLKNLKGIAGKRLFKDAKHYQSAYDYLTGNHEKVINELKNDEDYWAHYMRANSKWRLAQGIFEQSLKMDTKTQQNMQKQAIELTISTKSDYEQVIKNDPNSTLPPRWNYDLTTDPSAMARALMPKPIKIRVVLGGGGKKGENPGDERGDAPGRGILDLDKKSGDKPSQSPNPGSKREG